MDWQQRMTKAISWMEEHLLDEIDLSMAAREANCSAFHFMRMFEVITEISPAEYVRRRKLSLAAAELASSEEKILDIAIKYGYESPDSFARAFKREFNKLPSDARKDGAVLHAYPPITFTIAIKGDKAMEYRIEKMPAMVLTGLSRKVSCKNGENFKKIPMFWEEVIRDGRCDMLGKKSSALCVMGVCHEMETASDDFVYSIAIEKPSSVEGLPEGCEEIIVPESTYAKFTSRGPLHQNFQPMVKRIFSEWFPASGREHAGTAEIEFYGCEKDVNDSEYWCEYWVPLK